MNASKGLAALLLTALAAAAPAGAQMYRWTDDKDSVHYSSEAPPRGVQATKVDPDAEAAAPAATAECRTVRCEDERRAARLARREQIEAHLGAASAQPAHGLNFRKYLSIRRGITERELLGVAGEPDLLVWDSRFLKTYAYFPTPADPFTTAITVAGGRVVEIERERKRRF